MADDPNAYRVPLLRLSDIVGDTAQGTKNGNGAPPADASTYSTPKQMYEVRSAQEPSTGVVATPPPNEQRFSASALSRDAVPEEPTPREFGSSFKSEAHEEHVALKVPDIEISLPSPHSTGRQSIPPLFVPQEPESPTLHPVENTRTDTEIPALDIHKHSRPLRAWESAVVREKPMKPVFSDNPPDIWDAPNPAKNTQIRKESDRVPHPATRVPSTPSATESEKIPVHDALAYLANEHPSTKGNMVHKTPDSFEKPPQIPKRTISDSMGSPQITLAQALPAIRPTHAQPPLRNENLHPKTDDTVTEPSFVPTPSQEVSREIPPANTESPVLKENALSPHVVVRASIEGDTLASPVDRFTPPPTAQPLPHIPPVPQKIVVDENIHPTIHLKVNGTETQTVPVHAQIATHTTTTPQTPLEVEVVPKMTTQTPLSNISQKTPPLPTTHEPETKPSPEQVNTGTPQTTEATPTNQTTIPIAEVSTPQVAEQQPKSNLSELRGRVLKESLETQEPKSVTQKEGMGRVQSLVQVDIETLQETARMLGSLEEEPASPLLSTTHAQAIATVAKNLENIPTNASEAITPQITQEHNESVTRVADTLNPPPGVGDGTREQSVHMERPRTLKKTAPLPAPEPLAPMRTFKQDVERAMKHGDTPHGNTSSSQKNGARYTGGVLVRTARGTWLTPSVYLFAGVSVAIISGAVLALAVYFFPRGSWTTANTFVKVEKTLQIDTTEKEREAIMNELVGLRDTTSARSGYLTNIHVKKMIDIPLEGPTEIPVTTQGLFDQLEFRSPFALKTTLADTFMLGLHHRDDGVFPFLLIKSTAIEQTEQSMRTWETLLRDDVFPFFPKGEAYVTPPPNEPIEPIPARAPEDSDATSIEPYATSTDATVEPDTYESIPHEEATTGTSTPTESLVPTSTTTTPQAEVPTLFNVEGFTDTTIGTTPARIVRDGAGKVVLVWTVFDTFILITSHEETVEEVRARLQGRSH